MLILIEMENKMNSILNEVIEMLEFSAEDSIRISVEGRCFLLFDLIKANQLINWFLQNTEAKMTIKKASGNDLSIFENLPGYNEFLIKQIGVKEGEKWVVEQTSDNKYIALRRALPKEIKAYNEREDVIEIEPEKILRIISIGKDAAIEEIDFKYAIQYM